MKPRFRKLALPGLVILFATAIGSCSQERSAETGASAAPASELDNMINSQEKVTNEYVRVAKKLKSGDVSLTVRYIELEKATREGTAKLQQEAPKMTPQQAQRVAGLSARVAPFLQQ